MASKPQPGPDRAVVELDEGKLPGQAPGAQDRPAFYTDPGPQRRPEDLLQAQDNDRPAVRKKPRWRLGSALFAVVGLAVFGGIIWVAFHWGAANDGELPLLRAESTPIKTRPQRPGGLEVPHQDKLVLNEIRPDPEKPQVERLLPPPEVPKPPAPLAGPAAGPAVSSESPPASIAEAPAESSAPVEAAEPLPIPPPPAAAAEPPQTATAPPPSAKLQPAKARQVASPGAGGAFLVQLASLRARDTVAPEWARLQKAFPDLLGGAELRIQSVDLGSRGTFHRLRAGPFPDRASAAAVCTGLEARKQACLVVTR